MFRKNNIQEYIVVKSLKVFGWNNVGSASQTVAQHYFTIGYYVQLWASKTHYSKKTFVCLDQQLSIQIYPNTYPKIITIFQSLAKRTLFHTMWRIKGGGGSGGVLTPLLKIEFSKQHSKFLRPWYLAPTKSEPQTFHLFLAEETHTFLFLIDGTSKLQLTPSFC